MYNIKYILFHHDTVVTPRGLNHYDRLRTPVVVVIVFFFPLHNGVRRV
jgi:hypothetical protein